LVQHSERTFARWQHLLLSLAAVIPCVLAMMLAGAATESVLRAVARQRSSAQQLLTLRPRSSSTDLFIRCARQPGVAAVAAGSRAPYADPTLQQAHWSAAYLWTVRATADDLRFLPPIPGLSLAAGHPPQGPDEALAGYELAQVLRLHIGSTAWVQDRPFVIVGIWQPAGLAAGNFIQIPYEAAAALAMDSGSYDVLYVRPEAGSAPAALQTTLQVRLPEVVVQPPATVGDEEARLAHVLTLGFALLALLAALVSALGGTLTLRPMPAGRLQGALLAAPAGLLAGAFALCLGWGAALLLNADAARRYAVTPLALTWRSALLALLWPALWAGLAGAAALRRRAGELGRLLRGGLALLTVALAVVLALLAGGLNESLSLALQRAWSGNLGRLGLSFAGGGGASEAIMGQVAQIPGLSDTVLEAPGGAVRTEEDNWPGRPPSGVLYGLASRAGQTGMSTAYALGLASGRALQADNEALVGAELARSLGLKLGDVIAVRGQDLRVVGIRERWPWDATSPANYRVDITLAALCNLLGRPNLAAQVTVYVPPVTQEAQRARYLSLIGGQIAGLRTIGPSQVQEQVAAAFPGGRPLSDEAAKPLTQGLYLHLNLATLALACLVAGVSVAAALYPRYLEQRAEIGVRRLVGATAASILAEYLWQALAIVGLGCVLGAYAACVWAPAINGYFGGSTAWAPLVVTPRIIAATTLTVTVTALLFALRPALRAAAVDPAQTLGECNCSAERAGRGQARKTRNDKT
jgi:hypothetical protein